MGSLKSYFTLSGRLTPLQYWRFQVRLGLAAALIISLTSVATMAGGWLGAIPFAFVFPLLAAGVSVGVRRLHDRGKSAAWWVFFTLGPFVLVAPGALSKHAGPIALLIVAGLLSLAAVAIIFWAWIEIGFLRGQKGPNRYGPDPRTAA